MTIPKYPDKDKPDSNDQAQSTSKGGAEQPEVPEHVCLSPTPPQSPQPAWWFSVSEGTDRLNNLATVVPKPLQVACQT
jgi:hypothetical protein